MEQRPILSAGRADRELTPEAVRRRFAHAIAGARASDPATLATRRGDHSLVAGGTPPASALTPAAVLVPLVMRVEGLAVLLTQRTQHLAAHAGQISFPGGREEAEDADSVAAALRETEEEVGLPRDHVEVVGRLDTYVTSTGFEVTPVVGLVRVPYPSRLDPFEVAEIFEVPLAFLLDPANRQRHSREFKGRQRMFYVFLYENRYIWGATAGMLVNLAEVLTTPERHP
jgi:8-oxo-dGTP pyrophosphatase MutT (NUDIX family)